ncbi:hypothetical protein FRC10_007169 [Ceratobasidium sp. 414]|nr:hypothetical protein FRC10_007169 [Ceratobasidium sp. 414]
MSDSTLLALATQPARPFESIPIIDLSGLSGNAHERTRVADEIRDACVHVGFFYVKNHGVGNQIIEKVVKASQLFFDLPIEEKTKLDIHKSSNFKGYTALLGENTNPENRGDLHEGFDIGPEITTDNTSGASMTGSNVWPSTDISPGFREAVIEYYRAVIDLGLRLFPAFALALNLPEDFFADKVTCLPPPYSDPNRLVQIKNAAAIMRLLHYPPQIGVVDDRVQGIGAHTDYEVLLISLPPILSLLLITVFYNFMARCGSSVASTQYIRSMGRRHADPRHLCHQYWRSDGEMDQCVLDYRINVI